MNTEIAATQAASDLRIMSDDEINLVNGGSFWSFLGNMLVATGCFLVASVMMGLAVWGFSGGFDR